MQRLTAPSNLAVGQIEALSNSEEDFGWELDTRGNALAHKQVFTSSRVHDDTYTVELVPPFRNAWLIVDASLSTPGSLCSGKADAILRAEHKIFSFYAPC